jgi:hypothetical protein
VTVITEQGQQWNVSPVYLTKDIAPEQPPKSDANVYQISKKKK